MYLIIKNYIFTKEKQSSKKHIKNLKTSDIIKKTLLSLICILSISGIHAQDYLFFEYPYSYSISAMRSADANEQFLGSGHKFVANFAQTDHEYLFLLVVYLPASGGYFQVQLENITSYTTSRYIPTIDGINTTDTSWFTYAPTTGGNDDIITFYAFNQEEDPHIRQYIVDIITNRGKVNVIINQNPY